MPHVILTGDADWDPSVLDHDLEENEAWFNTVSDIPVDKPPSAFDEVGDYTKRVIVQSHDTSMHIADTCVMLHTLQAHATPHLPVDGPGLSQYQSHAHEITKHPPDYQALQPMFGWLPTDIIKQTFEVTTQYA